MTIRPSRGSSGSRASVLPGCREPAPAATVPPAPLLTGGERTELLQESDAVGDLALVGWVDEREPADVAQAQRGHLEDDRGERGALDLRLGELGAGLEVVLGVEPDAHAGRDAATPAGALRGAGPADRLDRQALDLGALAVTRDAGGAGVDDVADAGHGQRGLGDVGREDDPAATPAVEDPVLLGRGQPGEQRENLGVRQLERVQGVGGVADLALAGEEHEDVGGLGAGGRLGPQLLDGLDHAGHLVALGHDVPTVGVQLDERAVTQLHRVGAAGDLDDRDLAHDLAALVGGEVLREAHRVDRRGGDDHQQVGAARQQLLEVAEDEVDVERPLVGLVDDDGVVATQVAVALHLGEQDAVGHHLQPRRVAAVVGEPHLVAHEVAELDLHLLGDPLRDRPRGDPPGLGVPDLARSPTAELEAHLRQLGRLARPGLAGHDHHLVVAQRRQDVVTALDDGQVLGVPQPGRVDHVDGLGRHGAKDRSAPSRTPTGYPPGTVPRADRLPTGTPPHTPTRCPPTPPRRPVSTGRRPRAPTGSSAGRRPSSASASV